MKTLFRWITTLSLRFRAVTLALALLIAVLGVVAITRFKLELIPPVEFPQTIVLAQASGMSSEEVLAVLTTRLEEAIDGVEGVVNLESTTTGAFGGVIIARNEFGIDQERLRQEIRAALDGVWLPLRRIQPGPEQEAQEFAAELLNDLSPEALIYLAGADPNFLLRLSPAVWAALPEDAVRAALGYLAGQTEGNGESQGYLRNLIEQEIVPQLESLDVVADVTVSGGQLLPEETGNLPVPVAGAPVRQADSLLLQLSPEVWEVVSAKVGGLGPLNQETVETLRGEAVAVPVEAPELPQSWQRDHFSDARDLLEMRTLTRGLADVFNDFVETGRIIGPLGQTDDLTAETVTRMLEIAPSMVQYFEAEHLVAMPEEVFAALPDEYIAGLDGFTRDELAAAALAESITGVRAERRPVNLPAAWRIAPPQLISFSFDDLPLATFSVFGGVEAQTGTEVASAPDNPGHPNDADGNPGESASGEAGNSTGSANGATELPEGPPLPPVFSLIGLQFGVEMDTADDLINLRLPESAAEQLGASTLRAADLFNFMILLSDPSALPEGIEAPPIPLNVPALIGALSPEAVTFIAGHDPTFLPGLSPEVYNAFSDAVLSQPEVAPPLPDVWDTLAAQPQFDGQPLRTAADVLALGVGRASRVLNAINETVPERFSGYEVRLFDSLTPAIARYFALQEPGFYGNLEAAVLQKLSPMVLALLPQDVLDALDEEVAAQLIAIAAGEQPSAAAALADRYARDIPEADPSAPPINEAWGRVGSFYGIELDTADDFFRFPSDFLFPDPAAFMNSIFESPQGTAFAPNLFGGLTPEAVAYMLERDPAVFDDLRVEALQLLPEQTLSALPEALQERAAAGGEPFMPTATVTRTNGYPSLTLTVFKTSDANTVEAFHIVEDALAAISAENERIDISVAFEQASFIEESISGVAREGSLGALFAVIVILAFLSGGAWAPARQRLTGVVIVILALGLLLVVVLGQWEAANGDLGTAFALADPVVRVLLLGGIAAGVLLLAWPRPLPAPAWRSTLVTGISIPLSVLMAMVFMHWMPPLIHDLLAPIAADSPLVTFVLRLFPESVTLNIMTLSGLTVAIGRVVDDSIVVLENIFRQLQTGMDRREAIVSGTRDVSVAIFAATAVTVVVFLPLGMTGGLIGAFFLPFGLAVTYALVSSFIVAITAVPVLAYLLIDETEITEVHQDGWIARLYLPVLRRALGSNRNRLIVLGTAAVSMVIGVALFAARPTAFLPDFGEPQITLDLSLPQGTRIVETNALAEQLEEAIREIVPEDELTAIQTTVGGGGLSMESVLGVGGGVQENRAHITVGVKSSDRLDALARRIRAEAERIAGTDNVSVSAASLSAQGFGGFDLVLSGPQDVLAALDARVIETLNGIEGITNVSSNLSQVGDSGDGPTTYIRVDRQSAVSYTGELETNDTLGVTRQAIEAIRAMPDLPPGVTVSQGFVSEVQSQGFASLFVAMGIASVIVILILIVTFGSAVHWLDIMLSVVVAPVGAAVALTLTDRVLGISAMIGMLMLIGIVVTNAVVLIDRVMTNRRERHMPVEEALVEAGGRRLRPILMTALATIFALVPLAVGLSEGAIIAAELGTVVIGGLFSSTLLTLIVVPVAYEMLNPLHERIAGWLGRNG